MGELFRRWCGSFFGTIDKIAIVRENQWHDLASAFATPPTDLRCFHPLARDQTVLWLIDGL